MSAQPAIATKPTYEDLVREIEKAAETCREFGMVLRAFDHPRSALAALIAERALRETVARARG